MSLNVVSTALHGPMRAPGRGTHQYNVNREYSFDLGVLAGLVDGVFDGRHGRVSIEEAAEACRDAGRITADMGPEEADDEIGIEQGETPDVEGSWDGARNEIWFGPPGTGKSHQISERLQELGIPPERVRRVTFHPESL